MNDPAIEAAKIAEQRAIMIALATFVYDTVGCDLYEYNIEPYSDLIDQCVVNGDTTPIGEALVDSFLRYNAVADAERR